jgi:hypothetical protein
MSVTYYAPGVETYDIEGIVDGDYTSDGYMVSATSSPIIPLLEDPFIPVIGQKEVGTSGVYVNVRQFATFDLSGSDIGNIFHDSNPIHGTITSLTLNITVLYWFSYDSTETLVVYDAATTSELATGGANNLATYDDLGSGLVYGSIALHDDPTKDLLDLHYNIQPDSTYVAGGSGDIYHLRLSDSAVAAARSAQPGLFSIGMDLPTAVDHLGEPLYLTNSGIPFPASWGHAWEYLDLLVSLTITTDDNAPIANLDVVETNEDTAVYIHPLINDSDPDGDRLTIVNGADPLHGTVAIYNNTLYYPDSFIIYTPEANYSGEDDFTYVISDGYGKFDEATRQRQRRRRRSAHRAEGIRPAAWQRRAEC